MTCIGLMAGTSLDGIDAAVVDLTRDRKRVRMQLRAFKTYAYNSETVRLVMEASDPATGTVDRIARLNFYLGELFAASAKKIMKEAGVSRDEVDFIASHGQTIHHLPEPVKMGRHRIRATMQVGEPSVIAERTGITTVADFRPADIAAGGQGAPLVPFADWLMFSHPRKSRLMVNIGGISNMTLLPASEADTSKIYATDAGPGNMVINQLVARMTGGKRSYDRNGRLARRGKVNKELLDELMEHEFMRRKPPKSTGRETFGEEYVRLMLDKTQCASHRDYQDLIATATVLSARALADLYNKFYAPLAAADEVIVSGGGAKNSTLMKVLSELFSPVPVAPSDRYGVPARAKEAVAFAILGMETLEGRGANLKGATGARRKAILGKVCPAGTPL